MNRNKITLTISCTNRTQKTRCSAMQSKVHPLYTSHASPFDSMLGGGPPQAYLKIQDSWTWSIVEFMMPSPASCVSYPPTFLHACYRLPFMMSTWLQPVAADSNANRRQHAVVHNPADCYTFSSSKQFSVLNSFFLYTFKPAKSPNKWSVTPDQKKTYLLCCIRLSQQDSIVRSGLSF